MKIRVTVATRLFLSFVAVIAVFSAALVIGLNQLINFKATVHSITSGDLPKVDDANAWILLSEQRLRHTHDMLILDDPAKVKAEVDAVEDVKRREKEYTDRLAASASAPEEQAALKAAANAKANYERLEGGYLSLVQAGVIPSAKRVLLDEALPTQIEFMASLKKLVDMEQARITARAQAVDPAYERTRTIVILFSVGAAVVSFLVAFLAVRSLRRQLGGEPGDVTEIANKVAMGDYSSHITLRPGDTDSLIASVAKMQQGFIDRIEQDRKSAQKREALTAENARVRAALDASSAAATVADNDGTIVYVNEAALRIFRTRLPELRKHLPSFDPEQMLGKPFDAFHKNPSHQRNLLGQLSGNHTADVTLGSVLLRITASPVVDTNGKRIGTSVQWVDRTDEVAIERQIEEVITRVSDGDLTARVPEEGKTGFTEALTKGMNKIVDGTAVMVRTIRAAVDEVRSGADEIANGNVDLSQRTEQQSSSLEETASSMEEMTSTVKLTADNAAQARQLVVAAREQAEKGGRVMNSAVTAMGEINSASKKISDIIGVIDEIAFQTNLLALNAAVEAARAGEQGRGFAVVATEVRNLAGRSATAAKEIKSLINDSVAKVEEGSRLVDDSGKSLGDIGAAVKRVTDVVGEIAQASHEQASGIEQVNKAVMQMDEMTQQNAALVEEASAASASIVAQVTQLAELVARYNVGAEAARSAPGVKPALKAPAAAAAAERRAPNRPWNGAAAKRPPPKTTEHSAPKAKATTGARGDEWQDF